MLAVVVMPMKFPDLCESKKVNLLDLGRSSGSL